MNNPRDPELAAPASAPSANLLSDREQIRQLLGEAKRGAMVVLAGRSLFDSLSLGGLACRELASVGRAVIGTAPLSCGGAVHEGYREHAVHWAEAGGVLEEMLSALESGSRCTHVFGFGPWAAAAMQPIADLLPGAKRIVVDDSGELCAPDEDSYWNDSRAWLEHLDVTVIRVRDIFDALPPPQWPADSVRRLSDPLHAELRDKRVILLDEASDRPPAPEVLEAALRRWDHEKDRLVLLSRHASFHVQKYGESMDGRVLALDTRALAIPVYASLLDCADVYLAPAGCPFDLGAMRCIPEQCQRLIVEGDVSPGAGSMKNTRSFRDSRELLAHLNRDVPREGSRIAPSEGLAGTSAGLDRWWQQLGQLPNFKKTDNAARDFAILVYCHKYLQRFRAFLDSVARQDYPLERIEICVATCGGADGVPEYLEQFKIAHPKLAVRRVDVPAEHRRNRGKMINAAFAQSSAGVVMAADCDIILPRHFVATVLQRHRADLLLGCWRTPLSPDVTAHVITCNLDPVKHFDALRGQWDRSQEQEVRQGVLGYCQIAARSAFERVPYPEEFDCINQSDIVFAERLKEGLGVTVKFLDDLFVLHQHHPRNWSGTEVFL